MTAVITDIIRCGFVHISEARKNDLNGSMEFSMQLIIPEGSDTAVRIAEACKKIVTAKWGNNPPANIKMPLRSANAEGKKEAHMKDMLFMNVRTKDRPGIVDPDNFPHANPEDCRSGDWYRVSMGGFAYDKPSNGVSFGLNNVQWARKGESLTGRKRAEDEFGSLEERGSDAMFE
jgi:hypothetical protein